MTITVKRSEIQEVFNSDGVLIGYVENKDNYFRGLLLSAHYDIIIIED